jgi:predicted signal transduction protein with EAL and GGDEF domain
MHIFGKPIECGVQTLKVSISVGIALLWENAGDVNTLLKNADIALRMAKSQGYNKCQFYNPMTCESINSRYEIEALLKRTDIEKELELFYQPLFALPDKKLVGAEALLRWNNPEYGYISPGIFIPVAEETDCINKIGSWVMSRAIRQACEWNKDKRRLKISFNISPRQLKDDNFAAAIKDLISNKAVDAEWLETEITESVMLGDEFKTYAVLELIKKAGITISVDDFGSGYSSFSYLSNYPFDKIKIDKTLR